MLNIYNLLNDWKLIMIMIIINISSICECIYMSARNVNHQFQPPNLQKEDAGQSISEDVIIKL